MLKVILFADPVELQMFNASNPGHQLDAQQVSEPEHRFTLGLGIKVRQAMCGRMPESVHGILGAGLYFRLSLV